MFERRDKEFTDQTELDEEIKSRLLALAQEVLADTPKSTAETDFKEFCAGLATRMLEKAKGVLTEEQLEVLGHKMRGRVIG